MIMNAANDIDDDSEKLFRLILQLEGLTDYMLLIMHRLRGNPFCLNTNAEQFCGSHSDDDNEIDRSTNSTLDCRAQSCPTDYEYSPTSPIRCFCAAPLLVGYRLKSPGLSYFPAYKNLFEEYMTSGLKLNLYQLDIDSFRWEKGPRLRMDLKFFPVYDNSSGNSYVFNASEVGRIRSMFTGWNIPDSDIFGPYELINFTLQGPYRDGLSQKLYLICFT